MNFKRLTYICIALLLLSLLVVSGASAQDPGLPGSGWFTTFTLQNPGSGTANFSLDANQSTRNNTADTSATGNGCTVDGGASVIHNPNANNLGDNRIGFGEGQGCKTVDNLADGFEGGVVVTSDAPLAAVVSVGNNSPGSSGTASAFYQGVDGANADTTVNFPVAKKAFGGNTTTFYVQAVADANVTVSYSAAPSSQVAAPSDQTIGAIPAGSTAVVIIPGGDGFFGGASATSSTGAIVGSVIEHPTSGTAAYALSTRGSAPAEADTTVFAPVIKNDFSGGTTALVIQAVGGDVTVDVDFSRTNSIPDTLTCNGTTSGVSISEGATVVVGGPNDLNLPASFANGCFGSAVVTVAGGSGQVVATVNEVSGLGRAVYSGFPQSAASQSVAVPLVKEEFFNGRTAVVVQAVGDSGTTTKITANYVTSGGAASTCTSSSPCGVVPANGGAGDDSTNGGAAVNFRQLNNFSSQYTASTLPPVGTNNAVTVASDTLPVVVIAQEAVTGLDVKNYEGFGQ